MGRLLTLQHVFKFFPSLMLAGILPLASSLLVIGLGFGNRLHGTNGFSPRTGLISVYDREVVGASSISCEALNFSRQIRKRHTDSNSLHGRERRHYSRDDSRANLRSIAALGSPLSSTDGSDPPASDIAIPPLDPENQSKAEQEFYSMMRRFSGFTPRDIASVSSYRYRALFEGVAAGATEPQVIKAFAVIYEDLLPVRVGGRIIFKRLAQIMESSIERRDSVDETLQSVAGFTTEEIDEGRRAFAILDVDGEGELTIDQLIDSGIIETVAELLEYKSFDDFVIQLKKDDKGRLNFETFMIGLQRCSNDGCNYNCNFNEIFSEIVKMMEPIEEQKNKMTVSERKKKASAKYDSMVVAFGEWEDLVPEGDGRMIEVLRGCFAGAKNEKVLNALKIVYTDYSAIRIAGDLVFKLMCRLVVGGKQR